MDIKDTNGNLVLARWLSAACLWHRGLHCALGAGYDCLPANPVTGGQDWHGVVPASAQTSNIGIPAVKAGFWGTPTV